MHFKIKMNWYACAFEAFKGLKKYQQTFTCHRSKYVWYIFNLSKRIPCRFITYGIIKQKALIQHEVNGLILCNRQRMIEIEPCFSYTGCDADSMLSVLQTAVWSHGAVLLVPCTSSLSEPPWFASSIV